MIAWTPALAVGIAEIDEQHRELFRAADAFLTAMETSSREQVSELLAFLTKYALTHFGEEEQWMRAYQYPGYARHKARHDRFVDDLVALSTEHERYGAGLEPMRVAAWLGRWLIDHVAGDDTELAKFMMKRTA